MALLSSFGKRGKDLSPDLIQTFKELPIQVPWWGLPWHSLQLQDCGILQSVPADHHSSWWACLNFHPMNHHLQASTETWLQERDQRSSGAVGLLHRTLEARNHWTVLQTDQRQQIGTPTSSFSHYSHGCRENGVGPNISKHYYKTYEAKSMKGQNQALKAELGVFIYDSKWRFAEAVCVFQ